MTCLVSIIQNAKPEKYGVDPKPLAAIRIQALSHVPKPYKGGLEIMTGRLKGARQQVERNQAVGLSGSLVHHTKREAPSSIPRNHTEKTYVLVCNPVAGEVERGGRHSSLLSQPTPCDGLQESCGEALSPKQCRWLLRSAPAVTSGTRKNMTLPAHTQIRSEFRVYCQEEDVEETGLRSCLMLLFFLDKQCLRVPCYHKRGIMWTVHLRS